MPRTCIYRDTHTHTHTHTQPTVAVVLSVSALRTVKKTVVCVPVRDVPGLTASVELTASVRKNAVLAVASHVTMLTARRQAVLGVANLKVLTSPI